MPVLSWLNLIQIMEVLIVKKAPEKKAKKKVAKKTGKKAARCGCQCYCPPAYKADNAASAQTAMQG